MADENSQALWRAQEAIGSLAEAQLALNKRKEILGEAMGALIGSRVTIKGYPASARLFVGLDETTGRARYVSSPVYSIRATPEESQPRTLENRVVLAGDADSIEVSAQPSDTPAQPSQIVAYTFRLARILNLVEPRPVDPTRD